MGEAKRKAQARARLLEKADISRLSAALRKLASAASGHIGSDCYIHAALAQKILADLGVESTLVGGYAGWRVGPGDSDVVLHAPMPGMVIPENAAPYHAWLEIDGQILDLTTYSLRLKGMQLDEQDGGRTRVDWCPDYLYVPKQAVSLLRDVVQKQTGLFYYERVPAIEKRIIQAAPELDPDDVRTAWMLYHNPACEVFGPNNRINGKPLKTVDQRT
jgi:hypothetical protein